jgi:hypothetical protein
MALLMLLRRMGKDELTTHGFRSTFRDWAGDATNFQRETVPLAHTAGDKAKQAYRPGDALEKRRKLMEDCGAYCEGIGPLERIAGRTRRHRRQARSALLPNIAFPKPINDPSSARPTDAKIRPRF